MAADIDGTSTDGTGDPNHQPASSKSLGRASRSSGHNSEVADTGPTPGKATGNDIPQRNDPHVLWHAPNCCLESPGQSRVFLINAHRHTAHAAAKFAL